MSIEVTLHFILMGFLGAVLYILIWAKKLEDIYKFESVRHMVVGAIIGYIYTILYSEYGFPDLIMCLIAGYWGSDFVKALVERFRPSSK